MRALPIIERVLLVIFAVIILALLSGLLVWHLHWNNLLRRVAENQPREDVAAACACVEQRTTQRSGALVSQANDLPFSALILPGFDPDAPWLLGAKDGRPSDAIAALEAHRDRLALLRGLLERGLCLDGTDPDTWAWASESWCLAARIDSDPRSDLAALDQIMAAATPDSFEEADWLHLAVMRDDAYLGAAILGTIDADRLRSWQDEPDITIPTVLLHIEHERLADSAVAMNGFSHFPFASLRAADSAAVTTWWRIPIFFTNRIYRRQGEEDELLPALRLPAVISNSTEETYTQMFRHRLAVLASRFIIHARMERGVPASCALDLAAAPRLPALQYHPIDANRFSITTVIDEDPFLRKWQFAHDPHILPAIRQDLSSLDAETVVVVLDLEHGLPPGTR